MVWNTLCAGRIHAAPEQQIRYDDGPLVLPSAEFVLDGRSWLPRTALTYGFVSTTPDLGAATTKAAITEAFALWAAVTPLTFTEVADCGLPFNHPGCATPDIRIQFGAGNHGDSFPFDGPLKVLAHAFFPPPNGVTAAGDAHFDEDELWSDDLPPSGFDLVTVAAHEIGHSLGLNHAQTSKCPDPVTGVSSLMCPFYTGAHRFLAQDDIEGIQEIYDALVACITDPGEPGFATLTNISCSLNTLIAEVGAAGLSSQVTKRLTRKLKTVGAWLDRAQAACGQGNEERAKNKLETATKRIEGFQTRVTQEVEKGHIVAGMEVTLQEAAELILQQLATNLAAPSPCAE
jgi:hypothetical protein